MFNFFLLKEIGSKLLVKNNFCSKYEVKIYNLVVFYFFRLLFQCVFECFYIRLCETFTFPLWKWVKKNRPYFYYTAHYLYHYCLSSGIWSSLQLVNSVPSTVFSFTELSDPTFSLPLLSFSLLMDLPWRNLWQVDQNKGLSQEMPKTNVPR